MSEHRPLLAAVTKLLNDSLRSHKQIAVLLGVQTHVVSSWFNSEALPSDRELSMILRDFELTSGSAKTPHLPSVLAQFWDALRAIEMSPNDFHELPLNEGEHVSARLTRFTNYAWTQSLEDNIHLVHPSRRRALIKALTETFDQFTDD